MYLEYKEYRELGGILDEAAFNMYGTDAEIKVSTATRQRIYNVNDDTKTIVKICIARIVDIVKEERKSLSGTRVTSSGHDGFSQSFGVPTAAEYSAKISEIIDDFLGEQSDRDGIPLLYRGCGT